MNLMVKAETPEAIRVLGNAEIAVLMQQVDEPSTQISPCWDEKKRIFRVGLTLIYVQF